MSQGLRLCASCRQVLARRLAGLPGMYEACEQLLEVQRQDAVTVGRARRPTGISLEGRVVTVRGDTIGVLSSWCELVIAQRRVPGPGGRDVRTLTAFLQAHLGWLVLHTAAADFAEEIADLSAAVRQALDPAQVRTIDITPCPEDGCDRIVRATVSMARRRSVLRVGCEAGHTWQPRQWLDLRGRVTSTNCDVPA